MIFVKKQQKQIKRWKQQQQQNKTKTPKQNKKITMSQQSLFMKYI